MNDNSEAILEVARAMRDTLLSSDDEPITVVDGLLTIARSLDGLASAIHALGNGNAATPMGAIEAFGLHIGEKIDGLSNAILEAGDK